MNRVDTIKSSPAQQDRSAALRQAIIRVQPDYFSWTEDQQERYRLQVPDKDDFRIRQLLLKNLFQIQVTTEKEMEEVFDSFNDDQHLVFNSTILPFTGLGENSFFLNEFLGKQSLLDFSTLYDYDYDDYRFQQHSLKEQAPNHIEKPYRGSLYFCWARLLDGETFYYATLSCLAGYVNSIIDEVGFSKIQELIPFDYVPGKDHGKREGKGFLYDQQLEAGGLEAQCEELKDRFYHYLHERYETLLDICDQKAKKRVYFIERIEGNESHLDVIFSDKTAMQAVRFRHFMGDCRPLIGENQELDKVLDQERQAAIEYLEQTHQDVMKHFDPKVKTFRKKRRIILADSTLKDLL